MTTTSSRTASRHTALDRGAILAIVLVSYFMIILDNSVIFTGLPGLQTDLGLGSAELAWVQDAYTLVFGGLLLLGARAGDLLGRKPVFIFGLVVFSLASLLIALAPTAAWLIAARAVQGIGAAIVAPSALSLITVSFEGEARARAVAWYSATAGIGASLGMVVGGAAASWFSWRAGFLLNVPIGVAMLILAPRFLPQTSRVSGRFDVAGALTSTIGIGSLVFAILHAAEDGWATAPTLLALVVAAIALTLFIVAELRAVQPIMPLRLFASRIRTGAYVVRMLYMGAMIGFFFFVSQYLQASLGFTPLQTGIAFLPMTIVNFGVALFIPRITRRFGDAPVLAIGVLSTLGGMLWLSGIRADSDYLTAVVPPMLLIGVGQGLAFAPLTVFGIRGADAGDAGAASGALNTFHQIGGSLGLGVLVAIGVAVSSGNDRAAVVTAEASAALFAAAGFLVVAFILVMTLIVPAALAERRSSSVPSLSDRRSS